MEQPDFKNTYAKVNELLEEASKNVRNAESRLTKSEEEMKAEIEKIVEEKAEEIAKRFERRSPDTYGLFDETVDSRKDILPLLSLFPPHLGEKLVRKLFLKDVWKKMTSTQINAENTMYLFSSILSFLGECQNTENDREETVLGKKVFHDPVSFSFSEDDFLFPPYYFGLALPKYTTLTFRGTTGSNTGEKLHGGTLIIDGDVGWFTGSDMTDGMITISGTSGGNTGYRMLGGVLNIKDSVTSFHTSAFSSDNHGTIIYQGVTIFKDGKKTPEFDTMNVQVAT